MEQVRKAERLHDEIDPVGIYPVDYLKFRVTGHRPADEDDTLLVGEAVLADLRLMIELVSKTLAMPLSENESAMTLDALASHWNISTRTLGRWRKRGLRVRWARLHENDSEADARVVVMQNAIDHFAQKNPTLLAKAAAFDTIGEKDRQAIIDKARKLAADGEKSLNQVSRTLSQDVGRALETIRQLLQNHDAQNPDSAIFADRIKPLTPRQQQVIHRAHERGIAIEKIARHYGKTPSTIYRAIHHRQAMTLRNMKWTFIPTPGHDRPDADDIYLPKTIPTPKPCEINAADLPPAIASIFTQPGLEPADARSMLITLNYMKFKATCMRDALDRYEPRVSDIRSLQAMVHQIDHLRSRLAQAHLQHVLTAARRHLQGKPAWGQAVLLALLEAGNRVLFETLEQFDPSRQQTFANLLGYRLMRHFAQMELDQPRAMRKADPQQSVTQLHEDAKRWGIELMGDDGKVA